MNNEMEDKFALTPPPKSDDPRAAALKAKFGLDLPRLERDIVVKEDERNVVGNVENYIILNAPTLKSCNFLIDFVIYPGQGVGTIKLGMSKHEVERCIQEYETYEDGNRYFDPNLLPEYDEHQNLIAIQVVRDIDMLARANITCYGIPVFHLKASELVERMDSISPYHRGNDHELGYEYDFPIIGLSLYRSSVLTEKDLEADWFKAQSLDGQEYEKKFLYFETVMVCGTDSFRNYLKAKAGE